MLLGMGADMNAWYEYCEPLRNYNPSIVIFITVCLQILASHPVLAQQDSSHNDSSDVYRTIEEFSKKNKLTSLMYDMVFKGRDSTAVKRGPRHYQQERYGRFQGKIVRDIKIASLDPFGFSVTDTAKEPKNLFLRLGNNLHVKTQIFTISNLMLFGRNDRFDSLLVKESERLIRSQEYVREVFFEYNIVGKASDSIDIVVRVLDKWSFVPFADITNTRITLGFDESDFAGLGHEFGNSYSWFTSNGEKAFSTNYAVPNIRNTHIRTALHYNIDEHDDFEKSLTFERPFFSPLDRWAAGVNLMQQFQKYLINDTAHAGLGADLLWNTQDYWAGIATPVSPGNSEDDRTTNTVYAARYLHVLYLGKPDELHDSVHKYSDEDFYLAGAGISTRKFYRDHFIFNFGVIEDVPVGKVLGLIGGYQRRDNAGRIYLGARISFGDYNDLGYLSTDFEYGNFFKGTDLQQGVFFAEANYFSNLIEIGRWHIRLFAKPQITWGINMFSYDSLTFNNENGILGFNGAVAGTKKIVTTFQTQSYAPWNFYGFRFGPYLVCSLGIIGDETTGFSRSPLYSELGVGTLVQNDYLISSDFQLSVSYYPSIPGNGFNVFKVNVLSTTDFGFRDFIFGKPEITAFR